MIHGWIGFWRADHGVEHECQSWLKTILDAGSNRSWIACVTSARRRMLSALCRRGLIGAVSDRNE